LAQINTTVGDLSGNADRVVEQTRAAAESGAHVVVFPEMTLTGYPVEDLALRETFARASREQVDVVARRLGEAGCGEVVTYIGYLDKDEVGLRNAAAALWNGAVVATQYKHHLPNYGVFDERRTFKPGTELDVVRVHGVDVGMVICEDQIGRASWRERGQVRVGELGAGTERG